MPQNPYVCSTTWRGVPDLGVSPNCEMGVCGTNAAPAGHLVRLTAGREGSEVAFFGHGGPREDESVFIEEVEL